jgi:hypothetical protein
MRTDDAICAATAKAAATPTIRVDDIRPPPEIDLFVDLTNRFRAELGCYRVAALSSGTGTNFRFPSESNDFARGCDIRFAMHRFN